MVVSGVRIGCAASRLVLHREVDLVGSRNDDHLAQSQRAVVGDHRGVLVAVLHPHGPAIEVPVVLLEHVGFRPVLHDGAERQHDAVAPPLHRNQQLHALPRLELPGGEPVAVRPLLGAKQFVRQVDVELERPRFGIDPIGQIHDPQVGHHLAFLSGAIDDRREPPAVAGRLLQDRRILLEYLPLDVEPGMIREHAERIARLHVLPFGDPEFFDLEEPRAIGLVGPALLVELIGHGNREFPQERVFRHDLVDLSGR